MRCGRRRSVSALSPFGLLFIGTMIGSNYVGDWLFEWAMWIGIPVLLLLGAITRHRARRRIATAYQRRPDPAVPSAGRGGENGITRSQGTQAPRNERLFHSDRR